MRNLQPLQTSWSEFHRQRLAEGFVAQEMQQNMEGDSQQQQQQQVDDDPFKGVDMDLLTPETRAAIEKSQATMKEMRANANQTGVLQTELDRYKAQLDEANQRLQQQPKPGQQQQQRDQNTEPTFEEELLEEFLGQGIPKDVAAQMAKVQSKAFDRFARRTQKFVQGQVQPLAGSVAMNEATAIFNDLQVNSDIAEALQDNDVAQAVWEKVEAYVQAGNEVTPEIVENIAIITAHKAGRPVGQQQQQQAPQQFTTRQPRPAPTAQPRQAQTTTTRYSFPNAGHRARPDTNVTRGTRPVIDADTQAAVALTKSMMGAYGMSGPQKLPAITRG